jgi:predicted alpha/beta hydrolase
MTNYLQKEVLAKDGYKLTSRFYEPQGEILGTVIIAPAIGITQTYYATFASWLAARGFATVTFDYRGTGLSLSGRLRGFKANISDWIHLDCAAIIDTVATQVPHKPLYWIGHSMGGQIFPLIPNAKEISKIVTIGTGSGYWRENALNVKYRVLWLWYVAVPLATAVCDYFPGKKLRKVGDLPTGVIKQWRDWCLNPEYLIGVVPGARALFAEVKTPLVSISFTDDEYMSARSIESLNDYYINAPKTIKRLQPRDIGVKRIGHFGFFKEQFNTSLWQSYLLPELT